MFFKTSQFQFYESYGKRLFDFTFASILLICFLPVFLFITLVLLMSNGMPVFFSQPRGGKNGITFNLYKFRTMKNELNAQGKLLPDVERVTPVGRFIRNTSLDELPELWNILTGSMSFVGPRPLHARYLPRYNEAQMVRHSVRPGLTGLAQVKGRNNTSWDERFYWDTEYVQKVCLISDLRILCQTVQVVLSRTGAETADGGTMPEFRS